MKELLKNNRIAWVISAVLLLILLLMSKCSGKGGIQRGLITYADTVKITDTIRVTKEFKVYVPTIVKVTEPPQTLIDTVPYYDSTYCKQLAIDHYSEKEYLDTLKTEQGDSLELIIWARIKANKIDSIKPTVNVKIPFVKTIVTPIPKTPWKFYVGGSAGTNGLGFVGGPQIMLTDRKFMMYTAQVDFSTFSTPVYRIGVGVKLSIKKK